MPEQIKYVYFLSYGPQVLGTRADQQSTILPERAVVECRGSTVFPFKPSLDPLLFFFVSLQKSI